MLHDIDGLNTFVRLEGSGDSIVFVHGLGIDHRVWEDQLLHFSHSHEVLAYDLRGHGQTDAPETGYAYSDYVNDLDSIIAEFLRPPVNLVGLSMGGAIAFQYARKNPYNVMSLTLVGTHICGYVSFDGWPNMYKIAKNDGRDAARDVWKNSRLFSSIKSDGSRWEKLCRMIDGFSCAPWTDPHPRYDDDHDYSLASEVTAPSLILSGTGDGDFRPVSEHLALTLPDTRFESINCGHLINYERPDEFNEALAAFLREVV